MSNASWSPSAGPSRTQQLEQPNDRNQRPQSSFWPGRDTSSGFPSTVSEPTLPAIGVASHPIFKPKRKRITPVQLETLAAAFAVSDTPLYDVREELAGRLGMTNREVQVWFQNRRAKMARMRARASTADETPSSHDEMQPEPSASTSNMPPRSNTSAGSQSGSISNTYPASQFHVSIQQPQPPNPGVDNVREVNTALLPPSASSSSTFLYPRSGREQSPDTLSQSSVPSRASATASWLHSLHPESTFSYSPYSTNSTLPSTEYPESKASSDYGSHSFLSVRSAPTRMQGGSAPGNYLFGPPPVLPAPATDFLNLSLQKSNRPMLPLPPVAPTVPLPIPPGSVSIEQPQIASHWYDAWPRDHHIAIPPHLASKRDAQKDEEQIRRW